MFTPTEHGVLFETRPLSISSYRHTPLILCYQQQIIVLLVKYIYIYSLPKVPLCRGWHTLSHTIVINVLLGGGGCLKGAELGSRGCSLCNIILFYSSFIFYFTVVCETVLFWSKLKPLKEERRRWSAPMISYGRITSPPWCQRSLRIDTLNTAKGNTHTHLHLHAFNVRPLYLLRGLPLPCCKHLLRLALLLALSN